METPDRVDIIQRLKALEQKNAKVVNGKWVSKEPSPEPRGWARLLNLFLFGKSDAA